MWPLSAIWTFLAGDRYELTQEGQDVHQPSVPTSTRPSGWPPIRQPRPAVEAFPPSTTVLRTPRSSSALRERYLRRKTPRRSNRSGSPSPEPTSLSLLKPTTSPSQPLRTYRTPAEHPHSLMSMQERQPLPPPFASHRPLPLTRSPYDSRDNGSRLSSSSSKASVSPPYAPTSPTYSPSSPIADVHGAFNKSPSPPYSSATPPFQVNSGKVSVRILTRPAAIPPVTPSAGKAGKISKKSEAPELRRSSRKPSPKVLPAGVVLDPWNKSKKKVTKKSSLRDKSYVDRVTSESPAPSPTLAKPRKPVADKTYRDELVPDSPTPSPTIPTSKKRRAEEAFEVDAPSSKRKAGRPPKKTKPAALALNTSTPRDTTLSTQSSSQTEKLHKGSYHKRTVKFATVYRFLPSPRTASFGNKYIIGPRRARRR